MNAEVTLKDFYVAYAAWLDEGAPDTHYFEKRFGLCSNLATWIYATNAELDYARLVNELRKQFEDAGLCCQYPFGSGREYERMYATNTQHLNPARVAWVRKHTASA